MSILIKGMEMPTRCCECKMYVEDVYCCHLLNREIENPWADDGVELDCPLVPVPPHGRLIDVDVLRQDWLENGENEYVYDTNAFLDSLDHAPTIIEAEEGKA